MENINQTIICPRCTTPQVAVIQVTKEGTAIHKHTCENGKCGRKLGWLEWIPIK